MRSLPKKEVINAKEKNSIAQNTEDAKRMAEQFSKERHEVFAD